MALSRSLPWGNKDNKIGKGKKLKYPEVAKDVASDVSKNEESWSLSGLS